MKPTPTFSEEDTEILLQLSDLWASYIAGAMSEAELSTYSITILKSRKKDNVMTLNLKEMVQPGNKVHFSFYRQKELWYTHDNGFEFPVPIDDAGDGIFLKEDKAILFMRYIRKHIAAIDHAKVSQNVVNVNETPIP